MKRSDFPDTNDEEYKRSRFLPCALRFLYIDRFIGSMFVWKIGNKIKNFAMHWQKNMEEW